MTTTLLTFQGTTANVENILNTFEEATAQQQAEGMLWYAEAHELAASLSSNTATAAGVIAALSPMMSWTRNVALAKKAFADLRASGALGLSVKRANQILDGADPLDVLGGDKVRSFYLNILDPQGDDVTVDRHAFDVALNLRNSENDRTQIKGKRYAALADLYRDAAVVAGVLPNQMQAVTWTVWRERWAWRKSAA